MKKSMSMLGLALVSLTACNVEFSILDEAQTNLEQQLIVDSVLCNTESAGTLPVDTMYVGVSYQCSSFNPDGAEIRWGGQTFAFGGWYIVPDSAAIITIQGLVTPQHPMQFEVHARGTLESDGSKIIRAVLP